MRNAVSGTSVRKPMADRAWALGCVLLLMLWVFSALMTAYTVALSVAPLPSGDLLAYDRELLLAGTGRLDWAFLWAVQTDVHVVPLPKLIFLLDMRWTQGSGWLTASVSTLAVLLTVAMVVGGIARLPGWTRSEKCAASLMVALCLTSAVVSDSLVNPVNIQWSLLGLGTVLAGWGVQCGLENRIRPCLSSLVIGSVLIGSSGGAVLLLVLPALGLTGLWTQARFQELRRLLWRGLLVLLLVALLWEGVNRLLLDFRYPALVSLLYGLVWSDDWLVDINAWAADGPRFYLGWISAWSYYLAQCLLPPLGPIVWPVALWLLAAVWIGLLLRCLHHMQTHHGFLLFVTLFAFLVLLSAALLRAFYPVYSYRFANIGFLFLLSSSLLLYDTLCRASRWRRAVFLGALLCYAVVVMGVAVRESGAWSVWVQNSLRQAQLMYAVGMENPEGFSVAWRQGTGGQTETRLGFERHRLGAYGSEDHALYRGERRLPDNEVACEHRLLGAGRHDLNADGFWLRGESRGPDGQILTRVLIRSTGGENLGYGLRWLPSGSVWQQWRQPWQWQAQARRLGDSPTNVSIIAFNDRYRCQSWLVVHP